MPFTFVCFTDNSDNLYQNIDVRPLLPIEYIKGWWWKTYIFDANHFDLNDTNLFFDLDMVIINNIDKLIFYRPNEFICLADVGRVFGNPAKLGSAVMRWTGHGYSDIWSNYIKNTSIDQKYPSGDQAYIWDLHSKDINFYPKNWILSYKWEVRSREELVRIDKKLKFKTVRDPYIDPETSVLAFHGTPSLEDVQDKIIVENWQ